MVSKDGEAVDRLDSESEIRRVPGKRSEIKTVACECLNSQRNRVSRCPSSSLWRNTSGDRDTKWCWLVQMIPARRGSPLWKASGVWALKFWSFRFGET